MKLTVGRDRIRPPVAVLRDRNKEKRAERAAEGDTLGGRVLTARAPAALGLGEGRSMPEAERRHFESRLGADFSSVRLHPDTPAAGALGARGFASGRDIGIAPGHWHPGTAEFRHLLGHELAHVLQQGQSGPAVQLDDAKPPFKEAKAEDASGAVGGGLKTVADNLKDNEKLKDFALRLAKRHALPVWEGLKVDEKAALVGFGAATYGLGVGAMMSDPHGRQTLSGVNLAFPLKAVPYATLDGFSLTPPKSKTDPFGVRFKLKGDDLLELAHDKAGIPKVKLSFDFTLLVNPNGSVTMPFAMATFGVLPGVDVTAGFGMATDFKPMIQPQPNAPLAPYETYPNAAQPAPPGGPGVFVSVDLLKAPILPARIRKLLGGAPEGLADRPK
jgi:hypothetical protein